VSGTELLWFHHYLTDRQQSVKLGNSCSDLEAVLGGIPQGGALGQLLFLIYGNYMPLQVKYKVLVQFADDTWLICCGEYRTSVSQMICKDLCLLYSWVRDSRVNFNTKKNQIIIMWLMLGLRILLRFH